MATARNTSAWIAATLLVVWFLSSNMARANEKLDYAQLVGRLIDVERLAVLPAAGEACGQWSSYDRRSRYDEKTGQYVEWAANNDGFTTQFIRKEGESEVLAEMNGPGCIWRIWSANPKDGHVKIYLDGSDKPAVDLPFSKYFDRSSAPFNHPSLVYESARGKNSYVPISYQKSCKIVAEPGWGQYYHFTYSTFPSGTTVPTFTRDLPPESASALKRVADFLQDKLGTNPAAKRDGETSDPREVTVPAGKTVVVAELAGERAITALRVKADFDNRADEIAALRELVLRITWDGQDKPGVWCPLGDFFGTAMGVNRYKSLMAGMTEEGAYSYWYMPFVQGAKIELSNDGDQDRRLQIEVVHAPLTRPAAELGRFHAKWHRDLSPLPGADRWPDWTVLQTTGRGRFCGMMLHVWNPTAGHNWRLARDGGWWWGEGDEKFFVDGEKFPSTFGTGTEDYFGYAWCNPDLFAQAFHSQTLTQNNKGHQSLNRWQVADNIPFQKSFDGYLEKYYPNDYPTRYAVAAYWYLDAKGQDAHGEVPIADRTGYYDLTDAHEGENLAVIERTGGEAVPQTVMIEPQSGESIWSGGSQLWWQGAKLGDQLKLAVPVARKGRYRVKAGMTKAPDYAIAQLGFAGKTVLAPIDFYDKNLGPVEIFLGTHDLERGKHELTVKITGANEKAEKKHMIGIDYVKLEPVIEPGE